MMRTPLEGANDIIYAAVNPDLKGVGGVYFKDCKNGYTTAASRLLAETIKTGLSFL